MSSQNHPQDLLALSSLKEIVKKLRSSQGCPWNRAQTSQSLKKYLIEESNEAVEAIEEGHIDHIKEELGDVLHQVVLQSEIASEQGSFSIEDVIHQLCLKLMARNPHVFSNPTKLTLEEASEQWDAIKKEQRKSERFSEVGKGNPPLTRAICLQNEAAKVGFDWPNTSWIYGKIQEELLEIQEAVEKGDPDHIEDEVGDLLFAVASLSRALNVEPNMALRRANQKFAHRFEFVLEQLQTHPPVQNLDEWITLWKNAKKRVTFNESSSPIP